MVYPSQHSHYGYWQEYVSKELNLVDSIGHTEIRSLYPPKKHGL